MSQVIGQVWREVVGCRNWPVMRVPQLIALRRNGSNDYESSAIVSPVEQFDLVQWWSKSFH